MDRWKTKSVICDGGLDITTSLLEQGTLFPGSARELINYEPAEYKGYRRVRGYIKYDEDVVPGDSNEPILGVQPYGSGVVAVRKDTSGSTTHDAYLSAGVGWTKINSSTRGGSVNKVRFTTYSIVEPVIVICDGANPALKYNGSTDTTLNGTGAPADPKYAVEHLNRLVLSGYSANTSGVILSAPNDDTVYTSASGAIELNIGDEVVGLASFRDVLYIFCKNSIHKLEGSTSADFIIRSVTDRIGCVDGDTIQEVAGDIIFLAPDGFRSLAATDKFGDVEIALQSRQIQDLIREVIQSNPTNFSSVVVSSKSQYRCFYYSSGVEDNSQRGYLGKFKPTEQSQYQWAELIGFPVYSSGYKYLDNNNELIVIGHPTNGYVYQIEAGGSFDGEDIPSSYVTPPLTFDDIELRKVIFKLDTITQAEGDADLSVRAILDQYHDRNRIQPSAKILDIDGTGAVFGTAVFGTDVFAGESVPTIIGTRIEGSGYTITFKYTSSNGDEPHLIDSFTVSYSIKGRR